MSNATIAYLGPQGTYSDEAARLFAKKMGCENPEFVECPSFITRFEVPGGPGVRVVANSELCRSKTHLKAWLPPRSTPWLSRAA